MVAYALCAGCMAGRHRGPCWKLRDHEDPCEPGSKNDPRRAAESPLAGAIDRALDGRAPDLPIGPMRAYIRDAILAEIEAEWGPIAVERRGFSPRGKAILGATETRIRSEWRAKS